MKSEHRHELKTNELAQWITHFPEWARENRRMLVYLGIVAVIVIGYSIWYRHDTKTNKAQKQELTNELTRIPYTKAQIINAQAQNVDWSYRLIVVADSLGAISNSTDNSEMAALALIKQGELYRTELHYRPKTLPGGVFKSQVEKAKQSYLRAIEKRPSKSLLAKARLGLGLCEEEIGSFDEARRIYEEISTKEEFEFTTAAAIAQWRLTVMDNFREPLHFRPGLPPGMVEEPEMAEPFTQPLVLESEEPVEVIAAEPNLLQGQAEVNNPASAP